MEQRWSIQESAATALSQIGSPTVPYLIPLLSDQTDKAVRARAALALGRIGKEASAAIPHLRPLLQQDKKSQLLAAITLAEIGVEAEAVLPVLLQGLEIENYEVRKRVIFAIGKLGKSATAAVPALTKIGSDDSAEALIDIGDAAAFSSLMTCLTEKFSLCSDAIERKGSAAIPVLIQALQGTDTDTRHWAASVLGEIGQDAVPALLSALQSKDSAVRCEAIYALGTMKTHPVNTIESIERILHESTNSDERRLAASVLDMMGHDVTWFFSDNDLLAPSNASCPLRFDYYNSSFDFYTGKCVVNNNAPTQAQAVWEIIIGLASFFSDDEESDSVVQEAPDNVKQK